MDYRLFFRLCNEFEDIARRALTTPANTQQLMDLKAFMDKVESETIYALEKKLVQAKNRLVFLVDNAQFSPTDMRSNTKTFTWNGRMPGIIDEHRAIITEKKAQYEDALKVKSSTAKFFTDVLNSSLSSFKQML
jgi:dynein heavy chain, axonemal